MTDLAPETHRALATRFFNEVWELLDKTDRSPSDDLQMIHLAHASRLHWKFAGGAREWAIGEWQIARVYAVLGQSTAALYHAEAMRDMTADDALGPFLTGCAHEIMSRSCRVAGHRMRAGRHHATAAVIAEQLTDPEERELLLLDLADAR